MNSSVEPPVSNGSVVSDTSLPKTRRFYRRLAFVWQGVETLAFVFAFGYVALYVPYAPDVLGAVALISLLGMIRVPENALAQALNRRGWRFIRTLCFLVVTCVVATSALWTTFAIAHLVPVRPETLQPVVAPVETHLNVLDYLVRSQGSYGLMCLIGGAFIGLSIFFSARLFLLIYAAFTSPLPTIRMVPYVWISRQFSRSIFSRIEILPGVPTYGKGLDAILQNPQPLKGFFGTAVKITLGVMCWFSQLLFKVSLPLTIFVAFLAEPVGAKQDDLRKRIDENRASRFVIPGIFLAYATIGLAALKVIAFLNFDEEESWLRERGLSRLVEVIAPGQISLLHVCSVAGALLFLTRTWLIDKVPTQPVGASARWIDAMRRVRMLCAAYSTFCLLVLFVPALRQIDVLHHASKIAIVDLRQHSQDQGFIPASKARELLNQ